MQFITCKLINNTRGQRTYHTDNGNEIRHIRINVAGLKLKERQRLLRDKIASVWAGKYAYHQSNNLHEKVSTWVVV